MIYISGIITNSNGGSAEVNGSKKKILVDGCISTQKVSRKILKYIYNEIKQILKSLMSQSWPEIQIGSNM